MIRRKASGVRNTTSLMAETGALAPMEQLEPRQMLAATILNGQAIADQLRQVNSAPLIIPLAGRANNDLSAITGSVVYFDYVGFGRVFVEMFDALPGQADTNRTRTTPQTVSNFFSYIASNTFQNTIINRSIPGFIIQGGGFTRPNSNNVVPAPISTNPPVSSEAGNKNVRGTIAMALSGTNVNSATTQWFFNLVDNAFLDIQRPSGGPFSAFGKVIGDGMKIVDQVAAVQRFNANTFYGLSQNDSRFSDLPLRNFSSAPITPDNFVTISNIVRDTNSQELSQIFATARSSNSSLASATVDNNGNLVVNLGANRTGSATITVKYTAADGTFVEDNFVLNVLGTPVVGTLKVTPPVLANPGDTFKLSAGGVVGRGATITSVEFYVDGDGDGLFNLANDILLGTDTSSQGGFTLDVPTLDGNTPWDPGTYAFFVRAIDSANQISNVVTADGRINEQPVVNTFTGSPAPVARLSPLTFTLNITDDTKVKTVEIYRDTNGDGNFTLGTDKRLGTAKRQGLTDTWLFTAATKTFSAGSNRFFARAIDENKGTSLVAQTDVTVNNLAPTLAGAKLTPTIIPAIDRTFKVAAVTAKDLDGKINLFELWYDINGDNTLDGGDFKIGEDALPAGGWAVTAAASAANHFAVGANKLIARVRDFDGAFSSIVLLSAVVNAAPTFGAVTFAPNPIDRALKFGVTVANVADSDGTIKSVEVIWSKTGGGVPQSGDKILGKAKFNVGTNLYELLNVSATSITPGLQTFFVRVTDNLGNATVTSHQIQVI